MNVLVRIILSKLLCDVQRRVMIDLKASGVDFKSFGTQKVLDDGNYSELEIDDSSWDRQPYYEFVGFRCVIGIT